MYILTDNYVIVVTNYMYILTDNHVIVVTN